MSFERTVGCALTGWLVLMVFACGSGEQRAAPIAAAAPAPYANWADPLAGLERGADHTATVCARAGDDLLRSALCADGAPNIASLSDLQGALSIDTTRIDGFHPLAVAAESTAVAARSVSAINPRVIAFVPEALPYELLALAFARGEEFCEIAVRDRIDRELRFYLVAWRQACNDSPQGCRPGDLLTPATEQNWTEVTLYDETDLANSVVDCATCHQPNGPNTPKLLRMQESDPPWTHWLSTDTDGGNTLLADYLAAKGDETLAGMSRAQLQSSQPIELSAFVTETIPLQPNPFESQTIEDEVRANSDSANPAPSPTWQAAYDRAESGEAIAVPYYDVRVTDPDKLARMTAAYQAFQQGQLDAADLPDIRDVFPDDPKQLAALGAMTEPGLDGQAVLLQACSECHNTRLDPSLSRARFVANLQHVSDTEKALAVLRIQLPASDVHAMPPAQRRVLSAEAKQRAIEVLQQ